MRVVLREVSRGSCAQSVLEVRVLRNMSTHAAFTSMFYFLRDSGFIVKGACDLRAPYSISVKGLLLLEALS